MRDEKREAGCLFHFDNHLSKDESTFGSIELYQIGELCCESGYEVEPHFQYCYEISYIVSGSGYFYIDDECVRVGEGDIFFNSVGHIHRIRTGSSQPLRYVYMGFMFNDLADEEFAPIHTFFRSASYYHSKDTHNLMLPFYRNIDEFYSQKPYSNIMIKNYLEEIIVLSYRAFTEKAGSSTRYSPQKSPNSVGYTVYSVIRFIENHLFELGSIKSIAEKLGYSYTYLSHTFKNKTGMTLQRYISLKKIEKAMEMLNYGDISINQIATKLGYETLQSFSKAFSRIMGYPPSLYKSKRQEEALPEQ
ncbi:helix-turn-helix domain-containing protein [Cohnella faecalis]|uniref:AraC family transcriptional regulator n=1 Tax=Cohnella faecalis TaxID=2315694 RepID=A0A398CKQ8_9BACL|nr:AraC family transcriptional regulator [Cohnella faecalis]RIE00261.1 AraC family transcriptional regulator [Cohnella faecalis]